ncbi:LytTR family DNA-binding domain-containing protein [Runella sp.]|uniref:LytR/AlgR family response regulator transcription factor n=1 Tax=Runella sp. TaxID=1960881 RepID=UPI003018C5E8
MNLLPPLSPSHITLLRGRYSLPFEDIILIEGQDNYTLFKCRNGHEVLTSKSLSWYQKCLPPYLFRVHKSYFVNLAFVVSFKGETIRLSDGQCITVSRRRRREVRKLVKTHLVTPSSFQTSMSV